LPLGNHSHFVFVRFALIVDCNKHGNLWVSIRFFCFNEESYFEQAMNKGHGLPWRPPKFEEIVIENSKGNGMGRPGTAADFDP
jgi:hypothetical protein